MLSNICLPCIAILSFLPVHTAKHLLVGADVLVLAYCVDCVEFTLHFSDA